MKYVFTFNEVNTGRIEVEADHRPDNGEIINKILEGRADYNDTDFTDFKLVEVDGEAPNKATASTEGRQTFEVMITETLQKTVTVTANDLCEAEETVQGEWNNQDHILDADHFKGVRFDAVPVPAGV